MTRIEGERPARPLIGLFEAISDALLVIIGWVLWIAPLGVFALAFSVGASAGGAAFAGLGALYRPGLGDRSAGDLVGLSDCGAVADGSGSASSARR